nr:hypothetical protein GCM10020063_020420 [Dactylosporangium thailandense]
MTTTAQTRARGGAGTRTKATTGKKAAEATVTQPPTQTATRTATQTETKRPGKARAATKTGRTAPQTQRPAKETAEAPHPSGSQLVTWEDVPVPHLKMPVVHIEHPTEWSVADRARWTAGALRSAVGEPRPSRLLYYGGVGALAAFGVLEWPVALAAAAGVWVATHQRRATVAG